MKMTTSIFQTLSGRLCYQYPVLDVGHIHDNSRGNHGNMQSADINDVESIYDMALDIAGETTAHICICNVYNFIYLCFCC